MVILGVVVPLALYLVVLAFLNRQSRPLLVPGTWDFAGLLFGLSGIFMFLWPAVIGVIYDNRADWLGLKNTPDWASFRGGWGLIYLAYFVVVVASAAKLLIDRRRHTSVYNIDPQTFGDVLTDVLVAEGLPFKQIGNVVKVGEDHPVFVEVDASPTLCHVTLKWTPAASPWREQVEGKLATALDHRKAPDSMLSVFFLMAACVLLLVALGFMAADIIGHYL